MLAAAALFVCGALVWAGAFKAFARSAPLAAVQSGLPVWAYRTLGYAELAIALALFFVPLTAVALSVGFLGWLTYRRLTKPGSSCGCASAQPSPIGPRHFGRAGLMLLASLTLLPGWTLPLVQAVTVSLGLGLLYTAISPELDRWWLYPLRRAWVKLTHPLAGATSAEVPLLATVQQLQRSETFARVGALLRSDVVDSWDEGEWRILRYTIGLNDRLADAVFAVPRLSDEPERARFAIVER
jgi:hypothetical protein